MEQQHDSSIVKADKHCPVCECLYQNEPAHITSNATTGFVTPSNHCLNESSVPYTSTADLALELHDAVEIVTTFQRFNDAYTLECGHAMCSLCTVRWIIGQLELGKIHLYCSKEGCGTELSFSLIQNCLLEPFLENSSLNVQNLDDDNASNHNTNSNIGDNSLLCCIDKRRELFGNYTKALLDSYLISKEDFVACATADCPFGVIANRDLRYIICPVCSMRTCVHCKDFYYKSKKYKNIRKIHGGNSGSENNTSAFASKSELENYSFTSNTKITLKRPFGSLKCNLNQLLNSKNKSKNSLESQRQETLLMEMVEKKYTKLLEKHDVKHFCKPPGKYSKACPSCRTPVYKDGGCNHITCRCGHDFCWLCLKQINEMHFVNVSGCGYYSNKSASLAKIFVYKGLYYMLAPVGIVVINLCAIPAILIGYPISRTNKINKSELSSRSKRYKKHLKTLLLTPIVLGLSLILLTPGLLAFVYIQGPMDDTKTYKAHRKNTTKKKRLSKLKLGLKCPVLYTGNCVNVVDQEILDQLLTQHQSTPRGTREKIHRLLEAKFYETCQGVFDRHSA